MDIAGLDLNLLVVLEALLLERSVTKAARRVGLSQPALSAALGRLRAAFGDPLFVRSATGMLPTPRALEIEPELRLAMSGVRRVIEPARFDPEAATTTFRIATGDYAELFVLPPLLEALTRRAPRASVTVSPVAAHPLARLEDGSSDVVIAPFLDAGASVEVDRLFDEGFVCAMRRGHPASSGRLTLRRFARLRHLLVSPEGEGPSYVDSVLAREGLSREIAVRVPHFAVAVSLVASSDLVATLPQRLVPDGPREPVVAVRPPFTTMRFTMQAAWHRRTLASPAHRWLRALLVEVGATIAAQQG